MSNNIRNIPDTQGKITVTFPSNSICTVSNSTGYSLQSNQTPHTFNVPFTGDWNISSTDGVESAASNVNISAWGQTKAVSLFYTALPEFTYTGNWLWLNNDKSTGVLILTSSGTLTFKQAFDAQACLIGGGGGASLSGNYTGGGGGGSGYMTNKLSPFSLTSATISIGAGGASSDGVGKDGGQTKLTSSNYTGTANGGKGGQHAYGGNGGSGGGGSTVSDNSLTNKSVGGSNGSDGISIEQHYWAGGLSESNMAGKGSGITTRAFGETKMPLCCAGGMGRNNDSANSRSGTADNDYGRGGNYKSGETNGWAGAIFIRKYTG